MRTGFIVAYDISDPRRLARVAKTCLDFGDRIQKSVFFCLLNDGERAILQRRLRTLIDKKEDQVLLVRLGWVDLCDDSVESIGKPFVAEERTVVIV